jgi:DNA topoisomerase-2
VHHTEYRKFSNQARFVQEIIDGKLIVAKKKKVVLVQELRDRKYEPFPKVQDSRKKSTDEDLGTEGEEDNEGGAADFNYLLSVG